MTNTAKIKALLAAETRHERLTTAEFRMNEIERSMRAAERQAITIYRDEEEAAAAYARRKQSVAEAEAAKTRLGRNPGVRFLGLESPSYRSQRLMQEAIALHGQALNAAEHRHQTATRRAKAMRAKIASLAIARNTILLETQNDREDRSLVDARQTAAAVRAKLTAELSEVDIDEAVMGAAIDPLDAALARSAIRSRASMER
jgi:hypothetical protein